MTVVVVLVKVKVIHDDVGVGSSEHLDEKNTIRIWGWDRDIGVFTIV